MGIFIAGFIVGLLLGLYVGNTTFRARVNSMFKKVAQEAEKLAESDTKKRAK